MQLLAINTDILAKPMLSIGFGIIGIAMLIVGHKIFHAIDMGKKLTGMDFKEQIKAGNMAAAVYEGLVEAAFLLGLAYIVEQVVG